jgi:hypothetical protein
MKDGAHPSVPSWPSSVASFEGKILSALFDGAVVAIFGYAAIL